MGGFDIEGGQFQQYTTPHKAGVAGGWGIKDIAHNWLGFFLTGCKAGPALGLANQATPTSSVHIGGSFATPCPSTAKTAAYTLTINDETIKTDATGAAFNVTLPDATTCPGRCYTVKRIQAGANAVTINTTASQTIDGAGTYALSAQWKFVTVQSDGANWLICGNN